MFKKLMVAWVTLALIVALALPAYASISLTSGYIRTRINGYNLTDGGVLDLEGRVYLTLSGNVNDFTTWKAAFYTAYIDLSNWKNITASNNYLYMDYAFATITPPGIPIKLEVGSLSPSTYGVTAYYGDALSADSAPYYNGGVNIISDALFPGLTTSLVLLPDVNKDVAGNQESALLMANFSQAWGKIAGAVWSRKDRESVGYRVAASFNLVPNDLTLYLSYGKKPVNPTVVWDRSDYTIIGINIPRLNTEIGLNPYIEYDVDQGCLGIYFSKTLAPNTSLLVYIGQNNTPKNSDGTDNANFKKWFFTPYLSFSF